MKKTNKFLNATNVAYTQNTNHAYSTISFWENADDQFFNEYLSDEAVDRILAKNLSWLPPEHSLLAHPFNYKGIPYSFTAGLLTGAIVVFELNLLDENTAIQHEDDVNKIVDLACDYYCNRQLFLPVPEVFKGGFYMGTKLNVAFFCNPALVAKLQQYQTLEDKVGLLLQSMSAVYALQIASYLKGCKHILDAYSLD